MRHRLLKNPYKGINAHWHSMAQNPGESPTIWTSIHASHIVDITNALNQQLAPEYIARAEQSLQIWIDDDETQQQITRRPRPDSVIFRTGASATSRSPAPILEVGDDEAVIVVEIDDLLDEDKFVSSAVIYKPIDHKTMGKPLTRIELLSLDNKPGGKGYEGYLQNRLTAMRSGTSLIELDYLHQRPSPIKDVPTYPNDPGSHAYSLALSDMRSKHMTDPVTVVRLMDVDTPLPSKIPIPLMGEDVLVFDFGAVYHYTFEVGRWGTHIDYAVLPENFASYSAADQKRIQQVMERVKEQVE